MKVKNFGILTLCLVLLVSTFCTPVAFATENTAVAKYAGVELNEYGRNPQVGAYSTLATFNDNAEQQYGSDYGSTAFGTNLWYQVMSSDNKTKKYYSNGSGVTINGWGTNDDTFMQIKDHSTLGEITGIFRQFSEPIKHDEDAAYYFDFTASMYGNGGKTATDMRLGLLDNCENVSSNGREMSPEVKIYGGLKKHETNNTYYAQVSIDGGATVVTSDDAFEIGATAKYHFLMRLDIDADGNDTLRMKVFGEKATEPAEWTVTTTGDIAVNHEFLEIDAFDQNTSVRFFKLEAEKYNKSLLDSVQSTVDAKLANFKFSEKDSIEETIKTLPIGNIRAAYEAKLASLEESANTFFLQENFEKYTEAVQTDSGWVSSYKYNTNINTITTSAADVDGWKMNGWSSLYYMPSNGNLNSRFNINTDGKSVMLLKESGATYRHFQNSISKQVNGEYYFVCNAEVGNDYEEQRKYIDDRIIFGMGTNITGNYVGVKYSEEGLYAQMKVGDTPLAMGTKKYDSTAGIIYTFVTKLEIANSNLIVKMKIYPKGGVEPAQWELVSNPMALTADVNFIGFQGIAQSAIFYIHDIWAEKYIGANLIAVNNVRSDIANEVINSKAQIEDAIDVGFARNDLVASLEINTAPLLGQDITFDASGNTVSLKMHNSRSTTADVTPIMAYCKDGSVAGVTVGNKVELAAKTRNQNVTLTFDSDSLPDSFDSVRVFFWNDMADMKPVLDAWGKTIAQ